MTERERLEKRLARKRRAIAKTYRLLAKQLAGYLEELTALAMAGNLAAFLPPEVKAGAAGRERAGLRALDKATRGQGWRDTLADLKKPNTPKRAT